MGEFSDNANKSGMELVTSETDDDCSAKDVKPETAFKKFVQLILNATKDCNRREHSDVLFYRDQFAQIHDEKLKLLNSMFVPIEDNLSTVFGIEELNKQLLVKYKNKLEVEKQGHAAYDAYCNNILVEVSDKEKPEYDETSEWSHSTLLENIAKLKDQESRLKEACKDAILNQKVKREEYETKYKSLMKDVQFFEKYELEAIETHEKLELALFAMEKRFSLQTQEIIFS